MIVLLTEATEPLLLVLLLHLLGLFWIAMVCHGALALSRPPVAQLTTFYLCLAAGGALGGLFNALLAPTIFDSLVEYPAALVLGSIVPAFAFTRSPSTPKASRSQRQWDILLPLILTLITCGLMIAVQGADLPANRWKVGLIVGVPLVICYTFSKRPIRFGLGIGGILLCNSLNPSVYGTPTERVRSFFGIHRVTRDEHHRLLIHGNTEHGRQSLDPARKGEPLAYYSRSGPIGDLFGSLAPDDPRRQSVAVLGLGTGAIAAYAQAGERWTFYEIDASVISLARRQFSYLQGAIDRGGQVRVVPGDARIQIGRAPEKFGLIILDTFSSDSIPTHLFTREAFEIYRERLTGDGLLAVHHSSRYFNLQPVLGSLANAVRPPFTAICREDLWLSETDKRSGKAPSKWAVLFQNRQDPLLTRLSHTRWKQINVDERRPPWTDDHSNVLGAFEFNR